MTGVGEDPRPVSDFWRDGQPVPQPFLTMKPIPPRELARLKRRFELAVRLGDTTVLGEDGTVIHRYRGVRGWRRAWIRLRMWFA